MQIDEAIKELSESANAEMTTFDEDYKDAQKLGIEALKLIKALRLAEGSLKIPLLHGETEE